MSLPFGNLSWVALKNEESVHTSRVRQCIIQEALPNIGNNALTLN